MAEEKSFENKIKNYLESCGIYAFGTPANKMTKPIKGYYEKRFANRMTKKGLPDLSITIQGISLEVEVKAEYNKPSELQLFNIDLIRRSGGIAIVLYPSQWDDFLLLINDLLVHPQHIDTIRTEQKTFDERR